MANVVFPKNVFTTLKSFNDYSANDMHYRDMSEDRLKREFGLTNVSNVVDPYTLTRLTAFDNPQSRFAGVYGGKHNSGTVSIQECAKLLFEEMLKTSLPYSCIGPYKYLINQMLRHFYRSSGTPFNHEHLNAAYSHKLHSNYSTKNTVTYMRKSIGLLVDYQNKGFPQDRLKDLEAAIEISILPKFNSPIHDKINGMGITVHDVYATKIDIISFDVNDSGWKARVKFTGQDHFGLDVDDIRKKKFNQFQFFKIWFVLQRFSRFGFKPFLTNMEAVIDIEGKR